MFVFDLPQNVNESLCTMLDGSETWTQIAKFLEMPETDIELCRNATRQGGSPTSQILRIWSSRGFAVTRLYKLLVILKQRRAMLILQPFVPEEHHVKTEIAITSSPPMPSTSQPRPVRSLSVQSTHNPTSIGLPHDTIPTNTINSGASRRSSLYGELHDATNGFSVENIIGKGGYGVVYRGEWLHSIVAVKRIVSRKAESCADEERELVRQSLIEMKTLSFYRHDNILALYGYCLDGPEPCIVYQYMAGRSLEDRLQGKYDIPRLSWPERLSVMIGTCRGLNFLHTSREQALIHGDVKSANILLDAHLTPKLGDFGLSRLGHMEVRADAPPMIASHIKGTLAYLPPEFIRHKHLSPKLDVFSTGVVFFEIATGLHAYSASRKPEALVSFVHHLTRAHKVEKLENLQDGHVEDEDVTESKRTFSMLMRAGDVCSVSEPNARPSAHDVIGMLVL